MYSKKTKKTRGDAATEKQSAESEPSATVQALIDEVKTLSDEDAALLLAALQAKRKP